MTARYPGTDGALQTESDLDAVYDRAVDAGRDAAWHDADHAVTRLAHVCEGADTPEGRARVFGFVTGLSMVWEGVTLLDFLAGWPRPPEA